MASRSQTQYAQPGDILLVIHDFKARSGDELSLTRGDKIALIERDDDFGDGWYLGKHVGSEETGLFPEVYTTPAPKSISAAVAARRLASQSQTQESANSIAVKSNPDNSSMAPPVQPFAPESNGHAMAGPVEYDTSTSERDRSASAPLSYTNATRAPPFSSTDRRPLPTSTAQRSISLSNGTHQNSPVMNETLSVIEEHITDMSTPRHSLLMPERNNVQSGPEESHADAVRRLSYINGNETEEEESGMLTEEEVRAWSPDRVADHLEDMGVEQSHCQVFREQEISGDVLLGMDQGSLMLKEFELGSIGRRLALWQKVKAIQEEVRISRAVPRFSSDHDTNEGSFTDSGRNRSTSVGTVLPRIPSLMEGPNPRTPSRQQTQRTASHQKTHQTESLSSLPILKMEGQRLSQEPRPSAASVRELHNRRHSSIDSSANPQSQPEGSPTKVPAQKQPSHNKSGSFDRSWTMGSTTQSPTSNAAPQNVDSQFSTFPHEVGLKVVNQLDLDRGYFSSNESDTRKARNVLKKRTGESPSSHSRAPSDGDYVSTSRRLSGLFRNRAGSTDSLLDTSKASSPSAAQIYYGASQRAPPRAASGPVGKSWRHASPSASPTVTKLDYATSPSIDAVAAASPNFPSSETSSIDHPSPSPAAPGKTLFTRSRATGLRAISDAITGDEKASILTPKSGSLPSPVREAPMQPTTRTGSTTPSNTSKSMDMDDSSLLKSIASSSNLTPGASTAPRRRGKKSTSAYLRGLEKKSPKEQMEGCDYSGWMKKKSSNLMTTWKTRLFVLRGRRLSYYYSEKDTEEKGLIDISFHRVLPANSDRITGLHATVTGASNSPTSPQNSSIPTAASRDAKNAPEPGKGDATGIFIFKLVPPRVGLSKAVNFTKPTVHYFAVENVQQGRLWMAALMKATIDRDDVGQVITTYKEKTISLAKAKAMRQRPPALRDEEDEKAGEKGLAIDYSNDSNDAIDGAKEGSLTTDGTANTSSSENLQREEMKDVSIP